MACEPPDGACTGWPHRLLPRSSLPVPMAKKASRKKAAKKRTNYSGRKEKRAKK